MKNILLAPSDGRIVEIRQMQYCPHIQDQGYHIAIYLSLWDVHVIRFPLKGKVISVKHQKGQFHPAFLSKASENNEYVLIDIDSQFGKTYLKLIAGTVARRIVCRLNVGDQIESGNPFGIIKFGSRVELFLPLHINLKVREGDRVRAGEDIIGVFNRGF